MTGPGVCPYVAGALVAPPRGQCREHRVMADKPPPSLEDLDERLRKARGEQDQRESKPSRSRPIGQALRLATEMASALFVGAALGWFLDKWLGTRPLLLLLFLVLGMAAGMLNAYRTATRMQGAGEGDDQKDGG